MVVLILEKYVNNNIKKILVYFSFRGPCFSVIIQGFSYCISIPQCCVNILAFCCGVKVECVSISCVPDRDIQVQLAKSANMVAYG